MIVSFEEYLIALFSKFENIDLNDSLSVLIESLWSIVFLTVILFSISKVSKIFITKFISL